ncbi:MAG: hypothetical protein IT454_18380 [Planctomycetes bacterium]|nr:hypothetical protein [Planctomycetota bacterium]
MQRRELGVWVLVALVVAGLAWAARSIHDQRVANVPFEPDQGWFSPDPDSLYHMRRVERALDEGLPPAETDPRMNFPHGAAIPWPPYYTYVLYACVAPFAPSEPALRAAFIEQRVASLPRIFGVLTSLVVALAAARMLRERALAARTFAATTAGLGYALLGASLDYSGAGNGDHHAWVALLLALTLYASARALEREALDDKRGSVRRGLALGLLAGVMLGSWVGGLVYVVLVELALGVALFAHARRPLPGLAALGLSFHLAWAATLAPAIASSPWKSEQPWMMVNLSWLHLAHPLVGAAVFLPLATGFAERWRARWPWVVGVTLCALAMGLAWGDFALARSVREGFAWASRRNEFMAFITESQPLLWGQIGGLGPLLTQLGLGVVLCVPAAAWIAWRARTDARLDLAALALALPPLAVQALVQRRFADAFGVALSIALGVALTQWSARLWRERVGLALAAATLVGLVLQAPTLRATPLRLRSAWDASASVAPEQRDYRELLRWIAAHSDRHQMDAVLASWDQGHAIEWVAQRASIATNFGSYLGADSYLDPWRFFLEDEPERAEHILRERRARYVMLTGEFSKDLEVMLRLLRPEARRSYLLIPREGQVFTSQRFFSTMAARLMMNGRVGDLALRGLVGDSLPFLRLVHVAPRALDKPLPIRHTTTPVPAGWVWEYVEGARVVLHGTSGEAAELALELEYSSPAHFAGVERRVRWVSNTTIGADGRAIVRVPYATDAPNGDARALGPARATIGARSLEVTIRAADVESGASIEVH